MKYFQQRTYSPENDLNVRDMQYQDASGLRHYHSSQDAASVASINDDNSSIPILIGSKHVNVPFIPQTDFDEK